MTVSLEPAGAIQVNGGNWESTAGYCAYTLTLPSSITARTSEAHSSGTHKADSSDPITFVPVGPYYAPEGSDFPINVQNGQNPPYGCDTEALLTNGYGYAFAEQELTIGFCNTTSDAVGYAIAVNTSEQQAYVVYEYPNFLYWYASYEPGSIFFGIFQECMENTVGTPGAYTCWYGDYGPLL